MELYLYQQEKMASIGQLAAGVAHEINNPIGFISSNLGSCKKYLSKIMEYIEATSKYNDAEELQLLQKQLKLDFIFDDFNDLVGESIEGTNRVAEIVKNLKNFSRVDEKDQTQTDINECLENTLKVIWNELKYKTKVEKKYGKLPHILCFPKQLSQVFMNILINAAHSIKETGEITISTWHENNNIFITISDTGSGIAPNDLNKVFDHFFTTKEVGQGTGLGLSISYEIIKKHAGKIAVESNVGRGTTFTITIPVVEKL